MNSTSDSLVNRRHMALRSSVRFRLFHVLFFLFRPRGQEATFRTTSTCKQKLTCAGTGFRLFHFLFVSLSAPGSGGHLSHNIDMEAEADRRRHGM